MTETEPDVAELDDVETDEGYTSADEWQARGDGGSDLTLPSGAKVRVCQPKVALLQMTGRVPAYLLAIIRKHAADNKPWTVKESTWLVDWLITQSVTSVTITMTRKPGAVFIGDVSDADKNALIATLGLQVLAGMLR